MITENYTSEEARARLQQIVAGQRVAGDYGAGPGVSCTVVALDLQGFAGSW